MCAGFGNLITAQCFEVLGTTMMSPAAQEPANPTNPNIEAIAKLEHDALLRRTPTERASDAITKLIGSTAFLLLQVLLVLTWSTINLSMIPGVKAFDPFPFGILALVISSESVVLTIFVLISKIAWRVKQRNALTWTSKLACSRNRSSRLCFRCNTRFANAWASTLNPQKRAGRIQRRNRREQAGKRL